MKLYFLHLHLNLFLLGNLNLNQQVYQQKLIKLFLLFDLKKQNLMCYASNNHPHSSKSSIPVAPHPLRSPFWDATMKHSSHLSRRAFPLGLPSLGAYNPSADFSVFGCLTHFWTRITPTALQTIRSTQFSEFPADPPCSIDEDANPIGMEFHALGTRTFHVGQIFYVKIQSLLDGKPRTFVNPTKYFRPEILHSEGKRPPPPRSQNSASDLLFLLVLL